MIIINIGDELLIGQVVNNNAAYMTEKLTTAGFEVEETIVIPDEKEVIKQTIRNSLEKSNLVIMTGGLGPTKDDMTKEVLCDYFNVRMILNQEALAMVTELFAQRGLEVSESNRKQAEIPENAVILPNRNGTAQGLWMEKDGKVLVALPGVPFEMRGIMEEHLLPALARHFHSDLSIIHRVVQTAGIAESTLSDLLEPWETALPSFVKLAYLPRPGIIRLRLTAMGDNREVLEQTLEEELNKLVQIAGEYIWSYEDNQLEEVVGDLLRKLNAKLTIAESCTGGYLSHLITSVPGSSNYFKGSIVSYANDIKRSVLNVREQNLKKRGAVSEPVVSDMAINVMGLFDADYSIAVSGIAGPGGGTEERPVGTVWIAVATTTRMKTELFHFGTTGGRVNIIQRASVAALNMLRRELLFDLEKIKS